MEYFSVLDSDDKEIIRNIDSDTLNHFFIQSAIGCKKERDATAC